MPDSDRGEGQAFIEALQSGGLTFEDAKRQYEMLGDAIQKRFERKITAFSLDVVGSTRMKLESPTNALDVQKVFTNFHAWVEDKLVKHGCRKDDYTWSGDGLLAIFDRPEDAFALGRELIEGMPLFNRNAPGSPFQIRIGVHTGPILPDRSMGLTRIASPTLDLAGHLQKAAAPNQMLLSDTTYTLLSEGAGQLVPVEWDTPNPSHCFAFPPHTARRDVLSYPPRPAPPPPTPSTPVARSAATPSPLPWIVAIAGVGLAAIVGIGFALMPRSPGGSEGPIIIRSQRAAVQPARAANAPATPAPGTAPANAPAPVAVRPAAATQSPALSGPSRQLWTSPDAASGVPPRLVASPPEMRWLVAIGVGRYRDRSFGGETAGSDARLVAQSLQTSAGVPPEHTRVIADEAATLASIQDAFLWLQQNAASGRDTVFIYLAGAATLAPDRPDFRHSSGVGYAFLPHDTDQNNLQNTALYGVDLTAWLGATRAQTLLLLADTPYAGAMDLPSAVDAGRQLALFAAVGPAQRSGSPHGASASLFAETIAAGLRGEADLTRDRRISTDELQRYLIGEIGRRTGGAEAPSVRTGFGGYLPEFYFAPGG